MSFRTRLLVTASALTMFAGVGLVGSVSAGAVTTFNVANDHATCNSTSGTIKFASHLKNSGPTTGSNSAQLTIALTGCFDDDTSNVKMFKGATTMTVYTNNGSNCGGLLGMFGADGDSQIVWTPGAAQAFTPKTSVGTLQKSATNVHIDQVAGGAFAVPSANAPWNASYGYFSIGSAYSTSQVFTTADFAGGDGAAGGAVGWFAATTQEDIGNILTTCGSTAGLALLHFGIGATRWGGSGALPPNSSSTTCASGQPCASPTVTSADGSTSLQVTAAASNGPQPNTVQTLTLQVGGLPAMQCTLPGSGSVVSQYHTTASDAAKVAMYKVTGAAATFANKFVAAHTDISTCFGSNDPFNGYSPGSGAAAAGAASSKPTWAKGPYVYGPAQKDTSTGLYEAFLGSCSLHPQPCFVNTSGTTNTTEVRSPASAADPRVSH
jgi:hypothetical protein